MTAEHVTPCGFNDEIPVIYVEKPAFTKGGSLSDLALDIPMDRTRNPRGPDVPTLNLVATVVAAIEQKCKVSFSHTASVQSKAGESTTTKSQIIPPKRVRYLSEIAENNRGYDAWVNEQCSIASRLYQVTGVIDSLKESSEVAI